MVTSVKNGQKDPYKKAGDTAKIVGITLNSTSKAQVLRKITSRLDRQEKTFIVTPNPEFLVFANRNPWFKKILNKADFTIPDGIGLVWAGKILGKPIKERISGTDLMEELCRVAAEQDWCVYLLGGAPGVAKKALVSLRSCYPGLKGWAESGPRLELKSEILDHQEESVTLQPQDRIRQIVTEINQKSPTLLFVAFGMGKQEKFIGDNWQDLKVKIAMGVGGAFDYFSGEIPRPPAWSQNLGLEWFYRLIRQPWRWRRQLALIEFVWLVLKEKARR